MKKTRRRKAISLSVLVVLMAAGNSGCDYDPVIPAQRDIYTRMEDCVADWGDATLCQQMDETARKEEESKKDNQEGNHGGSSFVYLGGHPFYGPTYYGGNRVAYVGERAITPLKNRSASFRSTQIRTSTLPSKVVARGGFGGSGRSIAGGLGG